MRGLVAGLGLSLWCLTTAFASEAPAARKGASAATSAPAPSLATRGVTLGKPALPGTTQRLQAEAAQVVPALTVRAQAPEPDPPQPPAFLDGHKDAIPAASKSEPKLRATAADSEKSWLEFLLTDRMVRPAATETTTAATDLNAAKPPGELPAVLPAAELPAGPAAGASPSEPTLNARPALATPGPATSVAAVEELATPSDAPPEFLPEGACSITSCFELPRVMGYGGLYASAEYLHWWVSGYDIPPLVTTNRAGNLAAIGNPGTAVLFGDRELHDGDRSGGRLTLGVWLDCDQSCGLEVSGFYFPEDSEGFSANSGQFPILGRPFFNLNAGREDVQTIAFPGLAAGGVIVDAPSKFWGLEANARKNLVCGCDFLVDALVGVRYLELSEGLGVTELVVVEPGVPIFGGQTASVFDRFDTRNRFIGGQIGAVAEWRRGPWGVDLRGKLGLGVTHQEININGGQTVVGPNGGTTGFVGGLLALPSNIGHFSRDRFSVVPELGVTVRYQLTQNLYASLGYSVLYWSNVVRPGDQIDRVLDVTQIPNGPIGFQPTRLGRPAVLFRESDLWAHGISVGLELRY